MELNVQILQLADMYNRDKLKAACGETILNMLEIFNCIPSFIMTNRYFPSPESRFRQKMEAEQVIECEGWKQFVEKFSEMEREFERRKRCSLLPLLPHEMGLTCLSSYNCLGFIWYWFSEYIILIKTMAKLSIVRTVVHTKFNINFCFK